MLNCTINDFLDQLSSKAPVPGGGSVAAIQGALCCALGNMVCNLTIGKKKYSAYDAENQKLLDALSKLQDQFKLLYEADVKAFEDLVVTYKLPSQTDAEQKKKAEIMEPLLLSAIKAPMDMMESCILALELIQELSKHASALAISDIGVASSCAKACLESAILNVLINTSALENKEQASSLNQKADQLLRRGTEMADNIYHQISSGLR